MSDGPSVSNTKSNRSNASVIATEPSHNVKATLSPAENLIIGAFGGAVETSVQMPILTWKFCSQEGRAFPTTVGGWYRGVFVQAGKIFRAN